MKKIIMLIAVISLNSIFALHSYAEDDLADVKAEIERPTESSGKVNSLDKGNLGLLFTVPTSTSTSVLFKYFVAKKHAAELEVGFGFQFEDEDDGQASGFGLKFGVHYLGYFMDTRLTPYFKAGATIAKNGGDANEGYEDTQLSLDTGLGVEFFITKEFSIGGEALVGIPVLPAARIGTLTPNLTVGFYF